MPRTSLRSKHISHVVLIAVFAVIAMLPAYLGGIPGGNDQTQHFAFAATVYNGVSSGDIYPSFASETNHGLGDYGIRFYPPLTYYSLSAVFFVTRDWYVSGMAAFTIVFFLGGLGIYLWSNEMFASPQALIAALLYICAPYHLNELYNNALFAEFFATAILPFCFLFLTRICRSANWGDAAGLAISCSLLIITHLPATIICTLAMAIYTLFILRRATVVMVMAKVSAAVVSAVIMTAFYWSRFLPELDWIAHSSPKYFSATWDFRTNFLFIPDHFLKFGEDILNLWFADVMLVAGVLISVPTAIYLIRGKVEATKFAIAAATVLIFSVFMTTPLSSVVWSSAGFLQKVQFPWRWLMIISAFSAIFASIGIARYSESVKAGNRVFVTLGLGFVLAAFFFTGTFVTRGATFVSRADINRQLTNLGETESCDCWWPVWASREAFSQKDSVEIVGRDIASASFTPYRKRFTATAGPPGNATFATFYYPRWQATVNGEAASLASDENGLIIVPVPTVSAEVEIAFTEPPYVRFATIASAAWWILIVAFGAVIVGQRQFNRRSIAQ